MHPLRSLACGEEAEGWIREAKVRGQARVPQLRASRSPRAAPSPNATRWENSSRMGRKSKFVWTIRRAGSRREAPKCLPAGHRLDTDFNAVQRPLGPRTVVPLGWAAGGGPRCELETSTTATSPFGAGSSAELLQDSSIKIYLRLPQQRQDSPRPPLPFAQNPAGAGRTVRNELRQRS